MCVSITCLMVSIVFMCIIKFFISKTINVTIYTNLNEHAKLLIYYFVTGSLKEEHAQQHTQSSIKDLFFS